MVHLLEVSLKQDTEPQITPDVCGCMGKNVHQFRQKHRLNGCSSVSGRTRNTKYMSGRKFYIFVLHCLTFLVLVFFLVLKKLFEEKL